MANSSLITFADAYDHVGLVTSGSMAKTDQLQIALPAADDNEIVAGSLCSMAATGKEAQLGLRTTNSMPLIALNGAADYDVALSNVGMYKGSDPSFGNSTSSTAPSIGQYGSLNFIVGNRCYEMATTEWASASESSLTPDALLKAGSTAGEFDVLATFDASAQCVGQVSRGIIQTNDRVQSQQTACLYFWTRSELVQSA